MSVTIQVECLRCGATMDRIGERQFYGFNVAFLKFENRRVDAYVCQSCAHMEFFDLDTLQQINANMKPPMENL